MFVFQDIVYKSSLPVYRFLRVLGIFPYIRSEPGKAEVELGSKIVVYAVTVFILLTVRYLYEIGRSIGWKVYRNRHKAFLKSSNLGPENEINRVIVNISMFVHFQTYVFFIARHRIDIIQSLEGRFEESVIAYLFLLNILPILIIPMTWIETQKFTEVLNNWTEFEVISINCF